MRASFQGQNIIALGYGIARLQSPPLTMEPPKKPQKPGAKPESPKVRPKPPHQ
jgi:hypothetical protein